MVLFLSESDVEAAIGMAETIDAVEAVFRAEAKGETLELPRVSQSLPGTAGAFRMLSAALPKEMRFGIKTLTGFPGKRLPAETYFTVLLFDMESGALRAVISANHLTGLRTGAASGVAAKYMALPEAESLGVIGSGTQAWYQVEALCAVRPVKRVSIFSRDHDRATRFAADVEQRLQVDARVADSVREAVSDADMVITATTSATPLLQREWLRSGVHISAVGANTKNKSELAASCFAEATIVADSPQQVLEDSGDVVAAVSSGLVSSQCIAASLGEVAAQMKSGRTSVEEITIFKSVGVAIQDVAVASMLFRNAQQLGIGTRLDPFALSTSLVGTF